VYLTTSLTVPTGVTLDLTADGAKLALEGAAKLTVDGTVNASGHGDHGSGWVEGGLCIYDGTVVINGSGTLRLQSKGCVLNIWGDKKQLTLDGVTLVGIADNDNSLVEVGGGGALVMKSGTITGNTVSTGEWAGGGGVKVNGKGTTFIMEGGEVSGNSVNGDNGEGGGVKVEDGGTFTMKGGKISDNSINGSIENYGGGVKVNGKGTIFTMEGGEISGNSAQGGKGRQGGGVFGARGGGVDVNNGGTFTMKGGKISGNSANSSVENSASNVIQAVGGGVHINGSVFTMEGGEISGNSVTVKASGGGGGVFLDIGTFTMSGGIISGNNVSGKKAQGGGVMSGDAFTMLDGVISGNSTSGSTADSGGGGVYLRDSRDAVGAFTMLGGTIYGSASVANAGDNANEVRDGSGTPVTGRGAALAVQVKGKWGTGGAYTRGGVAQTGGSDIVPIDAKTGGRTDDTLIATPAR
jgi:hypothetical protein